MKRHKTKYPGTFYREVDRIGGRGKERMFYILFKKDGVLFEEKVGRQYADDMTPSKAARIRAERIEGKRLSRKQIREKKKEKADVWTLDRLWKQYKDSTNLKGVQEDESRYRNYISPLLGTKEPQNILPLDIDRLRIKRLAGLSPQTVTLTFKQINRIVNYGVKKQLSKPLSFRIEMPKVDNQTTETLTDEQIRNLMKALNEDIDQVGVSVMKLALFTGMRKGEILGLQWSDVDFEKGFILIRNPKGGKNATIPLNDSARNVLDKLPQTKNPYVFPGKHGQRRKGIGNTGRRIKARACLPEGFRPLHGLRHTYASVLASSGVDLFTLQKLLTHKSPQMTQRYAHLRDEPLRNASNLMGKIIEKIEKKGHEVVEQKVS